MINIYIPYTDRFLAVNMNLFLLTKKHPEWFETETRIASVYGVFPRCRWSGGRILFGDKASEDIIASTFSLYNSLGIRFRLTFTNSFVTKEHLNDEYANMILDIASESGINEVLVNNDIVENYIKDKYPGKFEFIQSVTKCDRDINSINKACEKYKLVVVDYRDGHDDNFLKLINNKDKAEIMVNDMCALNCPFRLEHHLDIQRLIITDGDIDKARELGFKEIVCKNNVRYSGGINIDDISKFVENDTAGSFTRDRLIDVQKLGFRNFKFVGRALDANVLALHYTYYLAKLECRQEFLKSLLNKQLDKILKELEDYYLD